MSGTGKILHFILLFVFCAFLKQVQAGWIFTGKYIDPDGKTIMQRYFFQGDYVKFERYNLIYTLNMKTGALILVDPENLVYYQGTLDNYIGELKKSKQKKLEVLLRDIPAGEQEEYSRLYNKQISAVGQPPVPVSDPVTFSPMNDSLRVGKYLAQKYQVNIKGLKAEEIWIAPGLKISASFDWSHFLSLVYILEPWNTSIRYMISGPFMELLQKGYPVRRIVQLGGFRSEFQVNRIEEKEIPEYEFYTPALCKAISLDKWIEHVPSAEPQYDDYE